MLARAAIQWMDPPRISPAMMPTDENSAVSRFSARFEDTGEAVDYDEIRRQLVRAVSRICPGWLRNEQEDLVQAALVRIVRLFDEAGEREPPSTSYVWRVAYSVTLDEIRRLRHRRERPMGEEDEERVPGGVPDPERANRSRQLGDAIRECLAGLAVARRHAVLLHHIGHTPKEAAALLGTNAKRISNLVYRGFDDLRRCMAAKGWAP